MERVKLSSIYETIFEGIGDGLSVNLKEDIDRLVWRKIRIGLSFDIYHSLKRVIENEENRVK